MGALILLPLRAFAWVYFVLPPTAQRTVGRSLGALLRIFKIRSKVVDQNLTLAFPRSLDRRREIFREAYAHLGCLTLEILLLLGPMRRYVLRYADLKGIEHWHEAKKLGKGVIFLANHVGNWEVMAATGGVHAGVDLMLVTKHLRPEWLHRAIETGRSRCGVSATYEPRTLRDVLSQLKKNGTVGFVLDQYAGAPVGVRVPVFGIPVGTTTAIATLAKRTGAPVLPVVNFRTPDGRWRMEVRPPIPWQTFESAPHELAANTANYALHMETDILAHPEQWLWIHRRFKGNLGPLRVGEWDEGRARS